MRRSSFTLKDAMFSMMQARPTKHTCQLHTLLMHKARQIPTTRCCWGCFALGTITTISVTFDDLTSSCHLCCNWLYFRIEPKQLAAEISYCSIESGIEENEELLGNVPRISNEILSYALFHFSGGCLPV